MSTTNLNITLVAQNQNSKYVTVNEGFARLAKALSAGMAVDLAGASGDVTLNATAALDALVINTSGAMAGEVNLIVPQYEKLWIVRHDATGYDLAIKTAVAASWATITAGNEGIVWGNGTNIFSIASSAGGGGAAIASAKTRAILNGSGGSGDLEIGANVTAASVEVYRSGLRLVEGAVPRDYTVTESSPGSGNYDQLTPSYSDAFPEGQENIVVFYYSA